MKFHILTLFPQMVTGGLNTSILGRAAEQELIKVNAVNIRDYTTDKHGKVDDYPYGGGAGMLMQAQPVFDAYQAVAGDRKLRTIYVTPQGRPFTQKIAEELAQETELVFLCGHYEGIDERVLEEVVTDYISIGDYVLTGGELPAMVMIDAISRLVPGVLHNEVSAETESFHNDLLEYPQYSRPESWHGKKVPEVLLSGNHRNIMKWRLEQSKQRTERRRPDLYEKYQRKCNVIRKLSRSKREYIHMMEALGRGNGEILYAEGEMVLLFDRKSQTVCMTAVSQSAAEKLLTRIPQETKEVLISRKDPGIGEMLAEYELCGAYRQYCFTRKETLPVKHKDIRRLDVADLEYLLVSCPEMPAEELQKRVTDGAMYGIYLEEELRGFIGIREDGGMGYLFVEDAYRGRGLGASLESYLINRQLEWGWTPYIQINIRNEAALKMQEKLGLYGSEGTIYRLKK